MTNIDGNRAGRAFGLLDPAAYGLVRRAFAESFPANEATEPHLRGVLQHVLDHPGSLVRAQLAFGILHARGVAGAASLGIAIAVEYFHTASLLFDDLPCMDDAATRRGHPCPHVVHGEAATVLGALALINRGYELLWGVLAELPHGTRLEGSRLVARCLGVGGILDGQALDLSYAGGPDAEAQVIRVAEGKTVSLVRLTLLLPAVVARATRTELDELDDLSRAWGLSYQILDDFKDSLMTRAETGKTTDMDRTRNRPNLPVAAGTDAAMSRLDSLLTASRERLKRLVDFDGRWRMLARLQAVLERERVEVRSRLEVAACP